MKERKSLRRTLAEWHETITLFWTVVVKYNVISARAVLAGKSERKTVLFYPELPKPFHVLYKICHMLGYNITNDPHAKADLVIHFEDTTVRNSDAMLSELGRHHKVLNLDCSDISKEHVDEVFREVFGYGTIVDPRTHAGKYVKKSNDNAKHYGKVIDHPTEPEKGFVYQRIINNQHGDSVLDLRVPIMNGTIPFAYQKYRPVGRRFENTNTVATLSAVYEVFSADEVKNMLLFCKKFGLDYGELDVLRDRDDNRLYIVDVNNTPAGPPNHISKPEYKLALAKMAEAFTSEFVPSRIA